MATTYYHLVLCCLHIYSYLELTGQVSMFSYFQFHFHFDCTFTSFFDDFLFPVSLCTTMPLHQCEVLNQAVTFSSIYDRPICKLNYNFQVLYFICIYVFFAENINFYVFYSRIFSYIFPIILIVGNPV